MKRLLLSNMRKWFSKPVFTRDGVLTIGYGYPNLLMAEGYNAPGSPYWALKAFACLALKEDHPFWNTPEKRYDAPGLCAQKHMRMLVARSKNNDHVIAYPAGNCCEAHAHCDAKYEKFAYSTVFGFSVPKTQKNLAGGAFDSMLALSEDGIYWHTRYQAKEYSIESDRIVSVWKPFAGVSVRTMIVPDGNWHLRIHMIETNRHLQAVEGGFAIARDDQGEAQIVCDEQQALVFAPWGVSGIKAVQGYGRGEVIRPEPNTNLMAARTLLPALRVQLPPGRHRLCCMVYGSPSADASEFDNVPQKIYDVLDERGRKR